MLSVMLISMLMIPFSILSVQASGFWRKLELIFELQSEVRDTVDWVRMWLFDFSAGKLNLLHLTVQVTGSIVVKVD